MIKTGHMRNGIFSSLVLTAIVSLLIGGGARGDSLETVDALSLTFQNGVVTPEDKHILVAGLPAEAIIQLCNSYHPDWTVDPVAEVRYRHTIDAIEIRGFAERTLFPEVENLAARNDIVFTYKLSKKGDSDEYTIIGAEGHAAFMAERLWKDKDATIGHGIFKLPVLFPAGPGYHGRYYWTVGVTYTQENKHTNPYFFNNDIITMSFYTRPHDDELYDLGLQAQVLVPDLYSAIKEGRFNEVVANDLSGCVFFQKYEEDKPGIPNWFEYWREDGACPSLESHKYEIDYKGSYEYMYGAYDLKSNRVCLYKENEKISGLMGVEIGPAGFHYPLGYEVCNSNDTSISYKFGGVDGKYVPYTGREYIYGIYTVEEVVAHEMMHKETITKYVNQWHTSFWNADSDCDEGEYYELVDDKVSGACVSKPESIKRCDYLTDRQEEKDYGQYKLSKDLLDTYGLARVKAKQYRFFGDNEFLSMIAANIATEEMRAKRECDWAYPGEQSYIPPLICNAPQYDGAAAEDGKLKFINMVTHVESSSESSPGIDALCYEFSIESSFADVLVLNGWLADTRGNPVATASLFVTNGVSVAGFRFAGSDIYESGVDGPYKLEQVDVMRFDGNEAHRLATCIDFENAEIDVSRDMFSRKAACIREDGIWDALSESGLEISLLLDVVAGGQYEIKARVTSVAGEDVALVTSKFSCTTGVNRVSLMIGEESISQVYCDGPYVIKTIELCEQGEMLEREYDFYELETTNLYVPGPCYVFFDPNGGTASEYFREVNSGSAIGDLPVPSKIGCSFDGWWTETDGGVRITAETVITSYQTYYAHWLSGGPAFEISDNTLVSVELNGCDAVSVPDGVISIGQYSFYGLSSLVSVNIPNSVTRIGACAFFGCSCLVEVTFEGDAPVVEDDAFAMILENCVVRLPRGNMTYEVVNNKWNGMGVEYYDLAREPTIEGDGGAVVEGNTESGFIITPSVTHGTIEVSIPVGVDAGKVTVAVSPTVETIRANGAAIKIVSGGNDITSYLVIPAADGAGVVNMGEATLNAERVFAEDKSGDNQENAEEMLAAVLDDDLTESTVKSAKPGLYYAMEASSEIGFPDNNEKTLSGEAVMAKSNTVTIPKPTKPSGNAVFYRIMVSTSAD